MEIQQLRHLVAAVRYGNLLKAADESNIGLSGISRSIKSLEARLGVPLLIRKAKGVEPTIYGVSLVRRAAAILDEVATAAEEVRAIEDAQIGDVSFGITHNYANHIVPDVLSLVALERPGMAINVRTGSFSELAGMVKVRALDFGFGIISPARQNEGIIIESLHEHHSRVIANPAHPLVGRTNVSVQELAKFRWVMLSNESVLRSFSSLFERHGLEAPCPMIKTDSVALIQGLTSRADVLAVLPHEAVEAQLEEGALVEIDCPTPMDKGCVGIFYRDVGLTPQAMFVINHLRMAYGLPATIAPSRQRTAQSVAVMQSRMQCL